MELEKSKIRARNADSDSKEEDSNEDCCGGGSRVEFAHTDLWR
jgi:hypothetical protein